MLGWGLTVNKRGRLTSRVVVRGERVADGMLVAVRDAQPKTRGR